jgi:hypothetical protein
MACHETNMIHGSMIWKNKMKNNNMMTWQLIPHHINLPDFIYPCHNSKIKNYVVQHVIIQNDLQPFH